MNNRPLILIISVVAAVLVIGLSIWGLTQPGNSIRINLPEGVDSISIDGTSRESGQRLAIRPGTYDYSLTGENIDTTPQEVTIEPGQKELVIDYAPYSTQHLRRLLSQHESTIQSIVRDKYLSKVEGYRIHKISLIDRGQYAAVVMTPTEFDINNPANVYRLILSETGESWQVVVEPKLLITTADTDEVDKKIIQAVNDLAL